jgi:hypothetical protein
MSRVLNAVRSTNALPPGSGGNATLRALACFWLAACGLAVSAGNGNDEDQGNAKIIAY